VWVPIACRLLRLLSHLTSAFVFGGQFPPWEDMERKEDRGVLHPAQTSQYKLLTLKAQSVLRPDNRSKPSVAVIDPTCDTIASPRSSACGRGPMRRTNFTHLQSTRYESGRELVTRTIHDCRRVPRRRAPLVPVECGPANTSEDGERERERKRENRSLGARVARGKKSDRN
jgi:hypothetical protein